MAKVELSPYETDTLNNIFDMNGSFDTQLVPIYGQIKILKNYI